MSPRAIYKNEPTCYSISENEPRHVLYLYVSHIAEDGEDQHGSQEARARVHHARDDGVPECSRSYTDRFLQINR